MGSKKNLVLASLVSLVMVLSFVIGLVPTMDSTGRDATAAPGAASVAISADGVTAVGSSYTIPVGGEQGFSALSLTGGSLSRLLATGEVEWSLASDGAAILTSQPGDLVATVSATAPGQAGLYVSTPDGLVDVVNLVFTELTPKGNGKALSQLAITSPVENSTIFVETGATGIPYVLTSQTDDETDVSGGVAYTWDAAQAVYSDAALIPPYAVTIPDITDAAVADVIGARTASLAASGAFYYDTSTYTLGGVDADTDGDGIPQDPFGIGLLPGDDYRNNSTAPEFDRQVAVVGLDSNIPAKAFPFYSDGTDVAIADPVDNTRFVTVSVPDGLIGENQVGLLFVAISNTAAGLLGETEAADLEPEPAAGIVTDGMYVQVSILVSDDAGATYTNLQELNLDTPVVVQIAGLATLADDNVTLFTHPSSLVDVGSGVDDAEIQVTTPATWTTPAGGTDVDAGVVSGRITTLGVVAPFATPDAPNISNIFNTETGQPSAYAIGGEEIAIELENVLSADGVYVLVDNMSTTITRTLENAGRVYTVYVTVPQAATVNPPVQSLAVDVAIQGTDEATGPYTDVQPGGLTYLGPTVTSVLPASGLSGDTITVTGEGFAPGMVVTLDGIAVTPTLAGDSASFTFTAPLHAPGATNLVVGYTNGYQTTQANAFTYNDVSFNIVVTPDTPQAAAGDEGGPFTPSQFEFAVSSEGAGTLTWTVADDATWLDLSSTGGSGNGTVTATINESATLLTPGVHTATLSFTSNAGNVTREVALTVSALTGPVQITSVTPNSGNTSGGNQVTIAGTGFGGVTLDTGPVVTTGTVLRLGDVETNASATQVIVPITLFRGPEQDPLNGPAAMDATVTFDTTKLAFNAAASGPDDLLFSWYRKDATFNLESPGTIKFVIAAINQNEITTFDNQLTGGTHNPNNQTNPFPMGNLVFDVIDLNPNELVPLTVTDLTMAGEDANDLPIEFGVASQDGSVYITGTAQPPVVTFGANTATIVSNTDTEIVATVPAGTEGPVNVRVTNPNLPAPNNFDILPSGYTYILPGGDLSLASVAPNRFWLFGGVTATLTGTGFDNTTQVYFGDASGTVPAPLPTAAQVVSVSDDGTTMTVVVPPLPNPAAVAGLAEVVTDVRAVKGEAQVEANDSVTYVHYETNGAISTTAFYFDTAAGTTADAGVLALDGEDTAELVVPALTAGAAVGNVTVNTGTLEARTFVLARATQDETLLQLDQALLPGEPLTGGWAFDVHMYDGVYPFGGELSLAFNTSAAEASFNTESNVARLTFPVDGLSVDEVQSGQATVFSLNTDLEYSANLNGGGENSGFTAFPNVATAKRYQSNIGTAEYTASGNSVETVTARLYSFTAYTLRTGFDPADVAQDALAIPDASDRSARTNQNKDIIITGANLNWVEAVYFGEGPIDSRDDLLDTTRFSEATILDRSDFALNVRTPIAPSGVSGNDIDIYLVFPQPEQQQTKALVPGVAVLQNGFNWTKRTIIGPLLLGLLVALLGLFSGGDGGGGGGPCFIATAAYGTPMADQIDTLRVFRDTFLLSNPVGTAFADMYYHVSPAIADVVAKSPALAAAVRVVLLPVIFMAKLFVAMPGVGMMLSSVGFGLLALRTMKRRNRKA